MLPVGWFWAARWSALCPVVAVGRLAWLDADGCVVCGCSVVVDVVVVPVVPVAVVPVVPVVRVVRFVPTTTNVPDAC